MLRWSDEQLASYRARRASREEAKRAATEIKVEPARAKYRNKRTTIDGRTFDSKLEATRYVELKRHMEGGVIFGLKCQVAFTLEVNGSLICKYVADFVYVDIDGNRVVEDAKGVRTRDYILKKKLMAAIHGIHIKEYRRERKQSPRKKNPV